MRTTFQLVTNSSGWISIPAAVAVLIACSASGGTPGPSGGTGGQGNGFGGQGVGTGTGTGTGTGVGTGTGGTLSGNGGTSSTTGGTPNGTTGGVPTTGSGGSPNGTGGSGGNTTAGTAGTGGATMVACSNTDKNTLPLNKSGWVARECNNAGVQGAFYCYTDGMTQAGCTADMPPFVEGKGMCLKGTTLGTTMGWGAGIGLSLNDSGKTATMASIKGPYNATTNKVKGFQIALSGSTGGLPLRINFPKLEKPAGVSPFVEVPGAPATTPYNILIADALVPKAWMVTNAGETADPASIFDIQVQLPGDSKAVPFDFCITSITPIVEGGTMMPPGGGMLTNYGSPQCGTYALINVPNYVVQNNAYGGNQHCIQAKTDNATKAGFLLSNIQASKPTGGAPGSYPSVIYGWHVDGKFYGGYQSAKTLGSITSIPTNMAFTVPGAGRYNASYDNWIGTAATSASSAGTLEQMIWLNYRDTTPIGSKVATVSLSGTTWDVWYGTHDGFRTVSYIRTNVTSMTFDINDFMKDTIMRGYAKSSDYLLGIQAGFEIWEGSGSGFSLDSFDVAVR